MNFGFLKDKIAKAQEKLNPMLSKVSEATSNAMSDMGLTATNQDRAPKPTRTIDEENLHESKAHGLLLDYGKTDNDYYVSVLNKVSKECHKLHNLGIYADVVSVTPSHALKFETKDNFVHCECYNAESPGNKYENNGTSENPFQHQFDELLDIGGESKAEDGADKAEEKESEEEEDDEKVEDSSEGDSEKDEEAESQEEEIDDDDRPEVKARDAEIAKIKDVEVGKIPNLSKKEKRGGILFGTVETFECDPEEDCPECNTAQVCQKCQGVKIVTCPHCGGHRECPTCNGERKETCKSCHGSGDCIRCHGNGKVECVGVLGCSGTGFDHYGKICTRCRGRGEVRCAVCHGNGKCDDCHGRGEVTCKDCGGTGRCAKCDGNGVVTCWHCDGSGLCPKCGGHGRITCHRCQGTGFFQQYIAYNAKGVTKTMVFCGTRNIKDALGNAVGELLYNDVYKQWINEDTLEFDTTDQPMRIALNNDEPLFREFEEAYKAFSNERHPNTAEDRPYNKAIRIQDIPVTRIEYIVDDNPYVLYIMGINSVVAYDKIPKSIEALRAGLFGKMKMLFNKKARAKAFAKLAAYIFASDGMSIDESRLLNLAVKKLELEPGEEKEFRESLKAFTPKMPYEEFRKEVKTLFDSKKTLAFAWECMSIDKQVSEAETELFNKLLAEFKMRPEHGEKIKVLAKRIATLSDKDIITEYLTN